MNIIREINPLESLDTGKIRVPSSLSLFQLLSVMRFREFGEEL